MRTYRTSDMTVYTQHWLHEDISGSSQPASFLDGRILQIRILHIIRGRIPPGICSGWWNMFVHGHPGSSGHWGHRLHTSPEYSNLWHSPLGFSGHHWGQWPCVNPWTIQKNHRIRRKMLCYYCYMWIGWKAMIWLDTFQICYSMIVKITLWKLLIFENLICKSLDWRMMPK